LDFCRCARGRCRRWRKEVYRFEDRQWRGYPVNQLEQCPGVGHGHAGHWPLVAAKLRLDNWAPSRIGNIGAAVYFGLLASACAAIRKSSRLSFQQ
jgi:hypothetical protein